MRRAWSLYIISTLVCIMCGNSAYAQLDPMLLGPAGPPTTEDLDSSRYIIKNKPISVPAATPAPAPVVNVEPVSSIAPPVVKVSNTPPPKPVKPKNDFNSQPIKVVPVEGDDDLDAIRWDTSRNILEFKTESFFVYNESLSNYKYRKYHTFSQGLGIEADVWFKSEWGLELSYKTTINSHTQGMLESSQLKSTERWFNFTFQFRSLSDNLMRDPYFVTKLGYFNYQKIMPTSNVERSSLEYMGPGLMVESYFPASKQSVWNISLKINPFQTHKEKRVGQDLSAGDDPKSWGWGLEIGNKIIFNRKNQFFWNAEYYLDKSIFGGISEKTNPGESSSLENVPVTNSFLFFNLGFIWGG